MQLLQRLLLHFLRHSRLFDFQAKLFGFLFLFVTLAEFLLDGFELFAQIEFALALRELPLHFGLDLLAQQQQFHLAGQLLVDVFEALDGVVLLEYCLPLGVRQTRKMCPR